MSKLVLPLAAALLALAAQPAHAQSVLGPDAAACRAGSETPAFLVSVSGFKNRAGTLRVQLYGSRPSDFLEKGKKLRRIDVPVTGSGTMNVCIRAPKAGNYAIAVRHDADGNGKSGWNDGGGFSRNPSISLVDLKPRHSEVVVSLGNAPRSIPVTLQYRRGLKIGPIGR